MKIAFFVQHLIWGGVEKALFELTKILSEERNDITIYMIKKCGGLVDFIPDSVKLMEIPMNTKVRKSIAVGGIKLSVKEAMTDHDFRRLIVLLYQYAKNQTGFTELGVDFGAIPSIQETYDIAVNFHIHSPFLVKYLSEKVSANVKYTWIHNDFVTTGYEISKLKSYLDCVDRFFCVSQQLYVEFLQYIPDYAEKTEIAYNIVPAKEILRKGEEYYPQEFEETEGLKLLTVGRLEEQKGYDLALEVCERLKHSGFVFRWYVLGAGSQKKFLESEVKKRDMVNYFRLLGTKANPYPYFKNCDIYVQTSRHEGYVTTVSEALIFNKPIVCTDVSGAREQLENGVTGKIVECNVNAIYDGLKTLIDSSDKRMNYAESISKRNHEQNNYIYLKWFRKK